MLPTKPSAHSVGIFSKETVYTALTNANITTTHDKEIHE